MTSDRSAGKIHNRENEINIDFSLQVLQRINKQGLLLLYSTGNDLQPDSRVFTAEIQRDEVVHDSFLLIRHTPEVGPDGFRRQERFRRGGGRSSLFRRAGGFGSLTEAWNDRQQQRQRRGGGQKPA